MSRTAKRIAERSKGDRLGAVKARELIAYYLPTVLRTLNDDQVDKVQRVLDADVVNPADKRELNYLEYQVTLQGVIQTGHPKYNEYLKAKQGSIQITDADRRQLLDFRMFLNSDALKPSTDNPDEAAFLPLVKETLRNQGLWMHVDKDTRNARHRSGFIVWLSLGPNSHDFHYLPTEDGKLTRKALLANKVIGGEYSQNVTYGPTRTALGREISRLNYQIVWGKKIHQDFAEDRANTNIVVRVVSEEAGRAGDFPDPAIWDLPNELIKKAKEHFDAGAVNAARVYLIAAAVQASIAARAYHNFIAAKDAGAGAAVKVLEVLKVAGEIAEIGLDLATGLEVLRLAKGGYQLVRRTIVRKEAAMPDAVMNKARVQLQEYVAKNPAVAGDLAKVGVEKGAAKVASRGPGAMPRAMYERGGTGRPPKNPQGVLDLSDTTETIGSGWGGQNYRYQQSIERIGYDVANDEIVVFRRVRVGGGSHSDVFHGHVEDWARLTAEQKSVLISEAAQKPRIYKASPKHGPGGWGSPEPKVKGKDLDNLLRKSEEVSDGHLVTYDKANKEIILFQRESAIEGWYEHYHGYVEEFAKLRQPEKNVLIKKGYFLPTGKPAK